MTLNTLESGMMELRMRREALGYTVHSLISTYFCAKQQSSMVYVNRIMYRSIAIYYNCMVKQEGFTYKDIH